MSYNHREIEAAWQKYWKENQTFQAHNPDSQSFEKSQPFYVLDMFPYPSGAGLHVGHPLGYIASDIITRYKRHQGYNVLHPMGYDSFGLPAEQYAIQTGQHPAVTTETNIERYRQQLDKIGFSFDWSREVRTSNPDYYKWTQWIFSQLFESWYDKNKDQARPISELLEIFASEGNRDLKAARDKNTLSFSETEWNQFSTQKKEEILLKYRLTYLAETEVNWCPGLGTVLANDEVINGVSERGGYLVERKKMKQWSMRITAYADRLLADLEKLNWSDSLKETQRNWIGKSEGVQIIFPILSGEEVKDIDKNGEIENINTAITYLNSENEHLFKKAKESREHPTEAEQVLWNRLKDNQLKCKFYTQHVIDDFIVNFVSYQRKLILEIDRKVYEESEEYKNKRTELLNKKGFEVIHFDHDKVKNNPDLIIDKVNSILDRLKSKELEVFTTRPDTIFGVTYLTLAPEHKLALKITTPKYQRAVEHYIEKTTKRSERERQMEAKKSITGVFTGAYAIHPLTKEPIPIWVGDYVLSGYGTGAVMAVPGGDERDYNFAKHFSGEVGMPPIKPIFKLDENNALKDDFYDKKEGYVYQNSDFLNGLNYEQAFPKIIDELEDSGFGKAIINYRLRDAVFSRQRYWGEPFPIFYKNGMPKLIPEECLPLELPEIEKYLPTQEGEPPLARAKKWYWDEKTKTTVSVADHQDLPEGVYKLELNTMPGWAGSSWYFFRYMEKTNREEVFASKEAMNYWQNVDLYLGGSEHATGHLLYARFWTKFLKDRGFAPVDEPFKKLINQGMILGESAFVYRVDFDYDLTSIHADYDNIKTRKRTENFIFQQLNEPKLFLSHSLLKRFNELGIAAFKELEASIEEKTKFIKEELKKERIKVEFDVHLKLTPIHVDVSLVNTSNELDFEGFKNWRSEFKNAEFITEEDGKYLVGREVEKMSKSKYNVVNPDDICEEYGADTLRIYEMFLGPIDQAKPWNTAGLSGVYSFLKKLWNLYFDKEENFAVSDEPASKEALKILHKTIKKVTQDIEGFNFNTAVSELMICVNKLSSLKCKSRGVLEPLTVLISPYAPHIAEELWKKLGHSEGISRVKYPIYEEKFLKETSKTYPISFNGKTRFTMSLSLELSKEQIEKIVMADERTKERLNGRQPKKIIIVPGKIVNIVG